MKVINSAVGIFVVKHNQQSITLDFSDLIEQAKSMGLKDVIFLHWQPFSQLWGMYLVSDNSYHVLPWGKILIDSDVNSLVIQVPKKAASHRPTAVVCYVNSLLINRDDKVVISNLKN
jgi:hypothetical protein